MKNKNSGLSIIGIIILGFVVLLVLSYFKISVKSVVESPTGQENIDYVTTNTRSLWNDYLKVPASYLWNDVFIEIFWNSFIDNMKAIKNNIPTNVENAAPHINIESTQ